MQPAKESEKKLPNEGKRLPLLAGRLLASKAKKVCKNQTEKESAASSLIAEAKMSKILKPLLNTNKETAGTSNPTKLSYDFKRLSFL